MNYSIKYSHIFKVL